MRGHTLMLTRVTVYGIVKEIKIRIKPCMFPFIVPDY